MEGHTCAAWIFLLKVVMRYLWIAELISNATQAAELAGVSEQRIVDCLLTMK